jgi:TetR/AcrR family transcriptional repressor of nem operon
MARPVEFEHDVVLSNAMEQFWKDGFEASSVQKLLDATNINRGTLYNSFGDKDTFFKACVDRYNLDLAAVLEQTLGNDSLKPAQAIKAFFDATLTGVSSQKRALGCLLVNSACESIIWDKEIQKIIKSSLKTIRKALLGRTKELDKSRKLAKGIDADLAADLLMNSLNGLRVNSRLGMAPKQISRLVESSISAVVK